MASNMGISLLANIFTLAFCERAPNGFAEDVNPYSRDGLWQEQGGAPRQSKNEELQRVARAGRAARAPTKRARHKV